MPAFHDEETVEFGLNSLTLALDFRTIDIIERMTGEDMPQVISALSNEPQTGLLSKVVWSMLRRHHAGLTLDYVGSLMLSAEYRSRVAGAAFDLILRAMNLGGEKPMEESSEVKWSLRDFLIEWVALGGPPAEFWQQTPRSYVAVMEGLARKAKRELDLAITTGWHSAIFALSGFNGKLNGKKLSDFLSSTQPTGADAEKLMNARAIHFFQSLRARGVPIKIERVTRH